MKYLLDLDLFSIDPNLRSLQKPRVGSVSLGILSTLIGVIFFALFVFRICATLNKNGD